MSTAEVLQVQRHYSGSPYEQPIGFCRAVRCGPAINVSGTAPIADDGTTVGVGDPYRQAQRCLELIDRAVVAVAGNSPAVIVRTRIYLLAAADWKAVARAHGERFVESPPASTFVVVAGLLDPAWRVEIEAQVYLRGFVPGDLTPK